MFKHKHTFMVTKTITVTEKAYKVLASDKKPNESFSELILRTHKKKGNVEDIMKFVGAWRHIPDKVIDNMKKDIENMNKHSMKSVAQKVRGL